MPSSISNDIGRPLSHSDLRLLLKKSLNINDCARIVTVNDHLPIRHRRSSADKKKFRCIITLN